MRRGRISVAGGICSHCAQNCTHLGARGFETAARYPRRNRRAGASRRRHLLGQHGVELLDRHAGRAAARARAASRPAPTPPPRRRRALAAGLEQQRNIEHRDRRALRLRLRRGTAARASRTSGCTIASSRCERRRIAEHARRQLGAVDLAVRRWCREMPPRSPPRPRRRRAGAPPRRHRAPARRPRRRTRAVVDLPMPSEPVRPRTNIGREFRRSLARYAGKAALAAQESSSGSSGRPRMVKWSPSTRRTDGCRGLRADRRRRSRSRRRRRHRDRRRGNRSEKSRMVSCAVVDSARTTIVAVAHERDRRMQLVGLAAQASRAARARPRDRPAW